MDRLQKRELMPLALSGESKYYTMLLVMSSPVPHYKISRLRFDSLVLNLGFSIFVL